MKRLFLITILLLISTKLVFAGEQKHYLQVRFYDDTAYGRVEQVKNYQFDSKLLPDVLAVLKMEKAAIDKDGADYVTAYVEKAKIPPVIVEPTQEELLAQYMTTLADGDYFLAKYTEKASKTDLEAVKVALDQKVSDVSTKITDKQIAEVIE